MSVPIENEGATIVRLVPGAPAVEIDYKLRPCSHHRVLVDPREREVTCAACKKVVDPIEALLNIARWWMGQESKLREFKERQEKERAASEERQARRNARTCQRCHRLRRTPQLAAECCGRGGGEG